jgi:hypothetical protein
MEQAPPDEPEPDNVETVIRYGNLVLRNPPEMGWDILPPKPSPEVATDGNW